MFDALLFKKYIEGTGIKISQTSSSYIFRCPKLECGKDDKFYIRKADGAFICFVCGFKGGKPEYALSKILDAPLNEVKFALYGTGEMRATKELDFDLDSFEYIDDRLISIAPVKYPINFYDLNDIKSKRGVDYLGSRGVSLEIANEYGIKYCPEERRIIFPAEYDGILYGWQARFVIPGEPRMLNSKSEDGWKSKILMFMDRLKGSEHCLITEGPFDAIKANLCGGNICTMGKLVSPTQINLIRRMNVSKVYLGLDPDAAEETAKLVKDLTKDLKCYLMEIPKQYKDLGEMEMKDVLEVYRSAKRVNNSHLFMYFKK